jgi:ribose transport system ATP-binding protein
MDHLAEHPVPDSADRPLITIRGACKRFGATHALSDVDVDVQGSSVLALLGQNGAGKSTLIKILAGVFPLDSGQITVGDDPLGSPAAAGRISFIHQDLGLVPGLSVAENVALGSGYPRRRGLIDWTSSRERAERALELVGSGLDPRTKVAELSRTERSLVAIGRALVVDAQVLVLDEPTASLPVDETDRLFTVLRRLRDSGMGLIYVSHRLDEVFEIADRVTIMRDGRVVSSGAIADITPAEVIRQIVGRTPVPAPPPAPPAQSRPVLQMKDVVSERVGPVSITLRAGEILGLVGLSGAGHVELGRTLIGALPCHDGSMELFGKEFRPLSVPAAVRDGIGFVTSNRAEEGLAMPLTVTENLLPNPALRGHRPWHFRRNGQELEQARALVTEFGVRPADPELIVSALSGGNQQKVILGRWLSTDAKVLVLEEPTAGVDVGAKHEIYTLLDQALARGVAVLLISTDYEEVAHVSHRALVFKDGLIVRDISRSELSVQTLVAFASGAAA